MKNSNAHRGIFLLAFTLPLALVLVASPSLAMAPAAMAPDRASVQMGWQDDLDKLLEEMIEALEGAKSSSSSSSHQLNLTTSNQAALDAYLDTALTKANAALDIALPEGGDLGDHGSIMSENPSTLEEYGSVCVNLAHAAHDEAEFGPDFDRDYVASRVKTIIHLITRSSPHNYRTIAGLEPAAPAAETGGSTPRAVADREPGVDEVESENEIDIDGEDRGARRGVAAS